VVSVVSSILTTEIDKVKRQIGSEKKKEFPCPYIVVRYQKNMQGIDNNDQMRAAGGGFALKAQYKKWYKRAYFAILDMMSLNLLIAWNLSTTVRSVKRSPLKRHEFLWYIAERMLQYRERKPAAKNLTEPEDNADADDSIGSSINLKGHQAVPSKDPNANCAICKIDFNVERQSLEGVNEETRSKKLYEIPKVAS
jgi:Transposase IS4